jgi:hypothetical protein
MRQVAQAAEDVPTPDGHVGSPRHALGVLQVEPLAQPHSFVMKTLKSVTPCGSSMATQGSQVLWVAQVVPQSDTCVGIVQVPLPPLLLEAVELLLEAVALEAVLVLIVEHCCWMSVTNLLQGASA